MPFEDKKVVCSDCGAEFVHSAEDQARYAERGFSHEPKRCPQCRESRRSQSGRGHGPGGPSRASGGSGGPGAPREARESYEVVCAECGAQTTVPFKPSGNRPVYCRDCFRNKRRPGPGR
jgi:CxxC-x17-CxxC domain-containing protein